MDDKIKMIGLISIGIVIGFLLTVVLLNYTIENIMGTLLSEIRIENINFDLNETALIEGMSDIVSEESDEVKG